MQDWDKLVMVLLGIGVAAYTGYRGVQFWRKENRGGAVGAFFLALVAVALPVMLAVSGG